MARKEKYPNITLEEFCRGVRKKENPRAKKMKLVVGIILIIVAGVSLGLFIFPLIWK